MILSLNFDTKHLLVLQDLCKRFNVYFVNLNRNFITNEMKQVYLSLDYTQCTNHAEFNRLLHLIASPVVENKREYSLLKQLKIKTKWLAFSIFEQLKRRFSL